MTDIAICWRRVERVLQHSPKAGLITDPVARVRWLGGTKVGCIRADGTEILTDMPPQLGGDGAGVTPGWLLRAGLASCAATTIALLAAAEGIALASVEVSASSQSDARGLFGMSTAEGDRISAAPFDMQLHVRIAAADGTAAEKLKALVEKSHLCAPVSCAVQESIPIGVHVECANA